jgi:hypothetical protein
MWLSRFRNLILGSRRPRQPAPKSRRRRLLLEQLEDRSLPSTFSAATVSDLIADINAANQAGGSNTIVLAGNTTFDLTTVDNQTDVANGLPVIAANDNLTILGQGGGIIQRDYSAPYFRLFDVASGGGLTLSDLTLQNGWVEPTALSTPAEGGAIYNQGTLVLSGVTLQFNTVLSIYASQVAAGGGIWSSGILTLENGTVVQRNTVSGGDGGAKTAGGNGFGGGIWSSGTLMLAAGTVIQSNTVAGGGGEFDTNNAGGNGFGGGLYIAAGTASLTGTSVTNNMAGV